MDVEFLTDEQRRQIKAARFLNKIKPKEYRLETESFMEGMILSERLIEEKTGEELVPWTVVNKMGVDFIES